MKEFRLDGKKALVTGAGGGIGKSISQALAGAGAHIFAVARSEEKLRELKREIEAGGGKCDFTPADVTDQGAMEKVVKENGPFRILVNNAGANRPSLVTDTEPRDYDAVMELNVKSVYFLAAAVAKDLIARGLTGSIINVSSQMGHVGGPKRGVYCASKHAVEGFTKCMAWEWGPHGIRVNSVCPTFVETPMTKPFFEDKEFMDGVMRSIALGRIGKPEEVALPVVFLASEASSLMTGSALMIDGGWTAR